MFVLVAAGSAGAQSALDADALKTLRANVFEVVALKPTHDPLKYAERLPTELIPYQERVDEYIPLGTAFAVGEGRFVSAAHVFALERETLWDRLYLRQPGGKALAVQTVWSYSSDRDFVVFDVADGDGASGLSPSTSVPLNDRVFAVGNALGSGVVIRDGILTSTTPENEDGAWKWLRFSAAASTGNSGGPLVDSAARVVGVVTAKSDSENLNFALPYAEVLSFPAGTAELRKRYSYRLPNIDGDYTERFRFSAGLPKPLPELRAEMSRFVGDVTRKCLQGLLAMEQAGLRTDAAGADGVLDTVTFSPFPTFASEKPDGTWQMSKPEKTTSYRVGGDGILELGDLWNDVFGLVTKPRDTSVASLFADPAKLLDLILEGYTMTRSLGTRKVRITSFGQPSVVERFADSWGRRWIVAAWDIPFANRAEVMLAHPTPNGAAVLLRLCAYWERGSYLADFRAMADYFNISYKGTYAEWKDYLAQDALSQAFFSDFSLQFSPGGQASIKCRRFSFDHDSQVMSVAPESVLYVMPAFFRERGVVLDVGRLFMAESSQLGRYVDIEKLSRPHPAASDRVRQTWDAARRGKYPFHQARILREGSSSIHAILDPARGAGEARFVYSIKVAANSDVSEDELRNRLSAAKRALVLTPYELAASALQLEAKPASAPER